MSEIREKYGPGSRGDRAEQQRRYRARKAARQSLTPPPSEEGTPPPSEEASGYDSPPPRRVGGGGPPEGSLETVQCGHCGGIFAVESAVEHVKKCKQQPDEVLALSSHGLFVAERGGKWFIKCNHNLWDTCPYNSAPEAIKGGRARVR